jgi:hypothetical protein
MLFPASGIHSDSISHFDNDIRPLALFSRKKNSTIMRRGPWIDVFGL